MSARRLMMSALAGALAAAGTGCFEPTLRSTELSDAAVLVINASATPIDVLVDNELVYPELAASMYTNLIPIRSGARSITLRTPGGQTATAAVNVSQWSTILLAGRPVAGTGALSAAVLPDTNALAVVGKSKLRVAHLAPNAPRLDVWRIQPDFEDSVRVMNPFEYPAVTPYVTSDPGPWRIWATSLSSVGGDTVFADTGPFDVPGATLVTVALVDSAGKLRFRIIQ